MTYLGALYQMVRKTARSDVVVLVIGALQEFVRINVSCVILKVRRESSHIQFCHYINRRHFDKGF